MALAAVEVEDQPGVLVNAEHERALREQGLENFEPTLAQVAEPGVVGAALGVVEVRDHGGAQPGSAAEDVEPLEPLRLRTDLVDLVDRDGHESERQSGGRREHHGATFPTCREPGVEGVGHG